MIAYETSTVTANGLAHRVLTWRARGERRAMPVVMVHGFMDAATSWDEVAPQIASAGHDVFALDLRGFGDTERVGAGGYYHFSDYLFDLSDVVDAIVPNAPHAPIGLVGHSMGGSVAALWAGTFPERVARLALLEGLGPPASPESLAPDRVRGWIDGVRRENRRAQRPMTLDDAVDRLAVVNAHVPRELVARRAVQLTRPSAEDPSLLVWKFDPRHRTTSPIGFSLERWRAHVARITAPTLIVGGGRRGFHTDDEDARIACFSRVRVEELADAGHSMHWTQPDALARLIVDHLAD